MGRITATVTIFLTCGLVVGGISFQETNQALPSAKAGETAPVFGTQALGDILYSFPAPSSRPWGLGWDGTDLWLSSEGNDTIYRLDPFTGSVLGSFPAPVFTPTGLTHDGQFLWLVNYDIPNMVYKIDPLTGAVVSSFPSPTTGGFTDGVTHDGQFLWVAGWGDPNIYQMDSATGTVVGTLSAPGTQSRDLTWDGSSFWIVDANTTGSVFQISPVDGTVISSFVLPSVDFPVGLTFDGQNLFVSGLFDNTIYYVDLPDQVSGKITETNGLGAICINRTAGTSVSIPLGGGESWSCTDAGLATLSGDNLLQIAVGVSASGTIPGGSITGVSGLLALCQNRSTGQSVTVPLGGTTSWNCTGLGVSSGDIVSQVLIATVN